MPITVAFPTQAMTRAAMRGAPHPVGRGDRDVWRLAHDHARRAMLSCRVRYPPIFDDLTFPNDVIRREHSPPVPSTPCQALEGRTRARLALAGRAWRACRDKLSVSIEQRDRQLRGVEC